MSLSGLLEPQMAPNFLQSFNQLIHQLVIVQGRWCKAKALGAAGHSWVVDRLNIYIVIEQQLVTGLFAQHRITHHDRHDVRV